MSEALNQPANQKILPIVVGAESETGRREENQDHMTGFTSRFGAVYVVADGMGGHRGGAEASRMVTEGVRNHLLASPLDLSLSDAVCEAARLTNQDLFEKSSSGDPKYAGMGSTLSLVVIGEGDSGMECVTAHVGDSRIYLERGGHLAVLTKDHTYVQRLLDSNIIDEETARTHPDASILTRAMGQTAEVKVDISEPIPLAEGDGILLCSDGLSGYVPQNLIEDTVRQYPGPSECAKALIDLALANGSDDNITVQFVRFGRSSTAPGAPGPRTNRKTLPESEVFPAADEGGRHEQGPWTGRARLLLAGLAIALSLSAAGVYAFRSSLFPKPPVVVDPYANLKATAEMQQRRANLLRKRADSGVAAVKTELKGRKSKDPLIKQLNKILGEFQKQSQTTGTLESRASNLTFPAMNPSTVAGSKPAAPTRDAPKQLADIDTQLGASQTAIENAEKELKDLQQGAKDQ